MFPSLLIRLINIPDRCRAAEAKGNPLLQLHLSSVFDFSDNILRLLPTLLYLLGDKGSNMDDSGLVQSLYYINMKWGSDSFAQKRLVEMSFRGKLFTFVLRVLLLECDLLFDFDLMPV